MAQVRCCDMRSKIFTWNIRHPYFFNCRIFSPSFSIDSCGCTRYYLEFLSKEVSERTYDVILLLHEHELHSEQGTIVLDIETTVTSDYLKGTRVFKDETFWKDKTIFHKSFSKSEYESTKEKDDFFLKVADVSLKNDINIVFKVNIAQHINCVKAKDLMACKSEDLESLSTDIVNIFHNKKFVDLALSSIDNKRVRLHKAIFASRYPTLAKSLNILETPKKEYNLDVDYDALSFLLLYLYSGKMSITDSIFDLHKLFKEAPLSHFLNILYSEPKYVHVSTSFPLKHAHFTLSIPNFKELQNDSVVVHYLSCDNLLAWTQLKILVYIVENAEGERSVAFKIERMEYDIKLLMALKISVVSQETYFKIYKLNSEFRREMDIDSFIEISEIQERENSFLTDGTLELRFEVILSNLETIFHENDSVEYMSADKRGPLMNLWTLSKDLQSLFKQDKFSDITIENDGEPIAAHKVILCARSPVLCRILEKETARKTIAINYDRNTVSNLLAYMYSGTIYDDFKCHDWALKLYKAATEYEVLQLKQNCIRYIQNTLTSDNVSRVLKLAVEYNVASLKASAETFMLAHVP